MLEIQFVSPHGLTDPLRDEHKRDDTRVLVDRKFSSLPGIRNRVFCGISFKAINSPAEFLMRMCLFLSISCFFPVFLFLTFVDSTTY